MAKKILPASRPKTDEQLIRRIVEHHGVPSDLCTIVFIRGYYLDSMGVKGKDDANIYDDACFLVTPEKITSFNANTGPSFPEKGYAMLDLGSYDYYRSYHHIAEPKKKYPAMRPYPEGVQLKCTRNNLPSVCQATNLHKGGTNATSFDVVWSQGCLTIPQSQYDEWLMAAWKAIHDHNQDRVGSKTISGRPELLTKVIICGNVERDGKQVIVDKAGNEI